MTLQKAIQALPWQEEIKTSLIKSAKDFGFDLNEEYPQNLTITQDGDDGDEYLEDNVGEKYFLHYTV